MSVTSEVDARLKKKEAEPVEYSALLTELVPRMQRAILGSHTVVDLSRGPRYLRRFIDADQAPWTPPMWAREWLSLCLDEAKGRNGMAAKRVPWTKRQLPMLEWPAPLYFGGPAVGEWGYVDLSSAYFSLYHRLALDTDYRPDGRDSRLGVGRVRFAGADGVHNKPVRQCASGIFRAFRPLTFYVRGEPTVGPSGVQWNRFLAPGLWGAMADSLHSIARTAVDTFGCVYWHTDGGVMPLDQAYRFVAWLDLDWSLAASIRSKGPGRVYGLGRWRIGQDGKGEARDLRPMSNLRTVDKGAARVLQRARG